MKVLLLGATGNIGGLVMKQLVSNNSNVSLSAIVRSKSRLPEQFQSNTNTLSITEASLLEMPSETLQEHVKGCDAIISCLGHKDVFGGSHTLVTDAVKLLCNSIITLNPQSPVKLILLNGAAVSHPDGTDPPRPFLDKMFFGVINSIISHLTDNQSAAEYLYNLNHPKVEWSVVRPGHFADGDDPVLPYHVQSNGYGTIFQKIQTRKGNTAHFMSQLAVDSKLWSNWKNKMPTIVDQLPA